MAFFLHIIPKIVNGEDVRIGEGDHFLEQLDAEISAGGVRTSACGDRNSDDFAQTADKPC